MTPVVAAQLDDPYLVRQLHTWLGDWQVRAQGLAGQGPEPLRDALRSGLNQARPSCHSLPTNAIAPGLVLPSENVTPEEWEKLVQRLPLQRQASVEEVASALEYLLDNGSVTGQTIVVDGGYSLP